MIEPCFLERKRLLPYTGKTIVRVGDWVSEEQTVARLDYMPGTMHRFQAALPLRVAGSALRERMLVPEGSPVQIGDAVAASFCFGERRVVTSPFQGFIGLVSRGLGHVYVREPIPVGSGEPQVLDVATELGVKPFLLGDCLRVIPGTAVVPGQVIATRRVERKMLMAQSSEYGKVTSIVDGVVTIEPLHVRTDLLAYLAGKVVQVMPDQGVVVRAFAYLLQGQYGVGGETGGSLLIAGQAHSILTAESVSPDWQDKVVVVGATADLEAIRAAAQAGAKALVMAYLPLRTLREFTGDTGTVGLTGDEDVPLTIVLTEGFNRAAISARFYSTLQTLAGRYAAVNGTTHIRAGVIRPEVIICEPGWPQESGAASLPSQEIVLGSTVRITREPGAGRIGIVTGLPFERQRIITGSSVRVAEVVVDQHKLVVPVSNLEIWSEAGGELHG